MYIYSISLQQLASSVAKHQSGARLIGLAEGEQRR